MQPEADWLENGALASRNGVKVILGADPSKITNVKQEVIACAKIPGCKVFPEPFSLVMLLSVISQIILTHLLFTVFDLNLISIIVVGDDTLLYL